jgi:hypothetical protein
VVLAFASALGGIGEKLTAKVRASVFPAACLLALASVSAYSDTDRRCAQPLPSLLARAKAWISGSSASAKQTHDSSVGELDTFAAYSSLKKSDRFLRQDAAYLPESHCGGTCASVSMVNTMLVIAEAEQPKVVSGASRFRIRSLHRDLLKQVLHALKEKHGIDGTQGAHFSNFDGVLHQAYESVFHRALPPGVVLKDLPRHGYQSIRPGKNSMLVLAVAMRDSSHAVVSANIKPPAGPEPLESFVMTISDPHEPGVFKDLRVFEANNALYLEGYGKPGKLVTISSYSKTEHVQAGMIQGSVLVNYAPHPATRVWTPEAVRELLGGTEIGGKVPDVDIYLKDGTVLEQVSIERIYETPPTVGYFERFILRGNQRLEDIADIQRHR